ncbi:MAG: hypothetical protein HY043_01195, partial [Verrucomicrobia bacterium]|nr:hypothetical protein [Verrucomicrobiota bacterium]
AGLYHYTTTTNQVKETNSTVDIGFHYVATTGSSSTTLVDTDADGAPDYWEDKNGNGTFDTTSNGNGGFTTTETDWQNPFTVVASFKAADRIGINGLPPDTMGAIGPNHFIELINNAVLVYNRNGTQPVGNQLMDVFFTLQDGSLPRDINGGKRTVDPRIIYSPVHQRWFATAFETGGTTNSQGLYTNGFQNTVLLAVSNGSDPIGANTNGWYTNAWKKYRIPELIQANAGVDFPTMGIDSNGIYVAANYFHYFGGAFTNQQIAAIPIAPLLLSNTCTATVWLQTNVYPIGSIQPVVNFDLISPTGTALFVRSSNNPAGLNYLRVAWDTNQQPILLDSAWQSVSTPNPASVASPADALQPSPGQAIDSVGFFGHSYIICGASQRNGLLWTCRAVGVFTNGVTRDGCQWFKFQVMNSGGTVTLNHLDSGEVWDSNATTTPWYYFYPSIVSNSRGDAVMGFSGSGSGANQFVSAYFTARQTGDAAGTMRLPRLIKAGEIAFDDPTLDPNDNLTIWTIQEYASTIGCSNTNKCSTWGTWIHAVSPY